MTKHTYQPSGVCATRIDFELENGIIRNVKFQNGCSGNLQGLARLLEGSNASEIITILSGIRCGRQATSCPDQFAQALKQAAGSD